MSNNLVQKNNLVVVIVTYLPENTFLDQLVFYSKISSKVVIVDNNSPNDFINKIVEFKHLGNLELILLNSNRGIATGLNIGIKRALNFSPSWILTFDQDSIPAQNILEVYNQILSNELKSIIGVISGGFSLNSDKVSFPIFWKSSIRLITSGMLHNVSIFQKVGFYNDKLFIDNVDFDFVMRVHKAGFYTIQIQNDIIKHKIGDPYTKTILGLTITSSNHNEIRRYYQARNLIYLTRKYILSFPCQIVNLNYYYYFKILPKMCLVERSLKKKLKATLIGLWDGLFFK